MPDVRSVMPDVRSVMPDVLGHLVPQITTSAICPLREGSQGLVTRM